ncbi:hypothetical protein F5148DRAFT_699676 [Russula earlei]|uniref:Uncharacterized protein n=2 Tax=Russula earlei TaxID=71964 RepID=A0ACC0TU98_9AGAM|nr:hypothetical protein F5148DRAFT_669568 [Russula earlei]KAI9509755.1 hypothetical protein F5148DRAFT_699676 [Russula earlei]
MLRAQGSQACKPGKQSIKVLIDHDVIKQISLRRFTVGHVQERAHQEYKSQCLDSQCPPAALLFVSLLVLVTNSIFSTAFLTAFQSTIITMRTSVIVAFICLTMGVAPSFSLPSISVRSNPSKRSVDQSHGGTNGSNSGQSVPPDLNEITPRFFSKGGISSSPYFRNKNVYGKHGGVHSSDVQGPASSHEPGQARPE